MSNGDPLRSCSTIPVGLSNRMQSLMPQPTTSFRLVPQRQADGAGAQMRALVEFHKGRPGTRTTDNDSLSGAILRVLRAGLRRSIPPLLVGLLATSLGHASQPTGPGLTPAAAEAKAREVEKKMTDDERFSLIKNLMVVN